MICLGVVFVASTLLEFYDIYWLCGLKFLLTLEQLLDSVSSNLASSSSAQGVSVPPGTPVMFTHHLFIVPLSSLALFSVISNPSSLCTLICLSSSLIFSSAVSGLIEKMLFSCTFAFWANIEELLHGRGFPGVSVVKNPPARAGDVGSIPGSAISPGEGNGNPFQYSCLGNPLDRRVMGSRSMRMWKSWDRT